ncbi:hypothetical protein Tco_0471764 [Tanacetum coccineum]
MELYSLKLKEGSNLHDHINSFNQLVCQLANVDDAIKDEEQALLMLSSLPKSYKPFVQTMLTGRTTLTFEDVLKALRDNERMTGNDSSSSSDKLLLADDSGRGRNFQRGSSKGRLKSRMGGDRDMSVDNGGDEFLMTETLMDGILREEKPKWVLDNATSSHICNDRAMFETLNDNGQFGEIKVGSKHMMKIEGVGSVRFKLHDGIPWGPVCWKIKTLAEGEALQGRTCCGGNKGKKKIEEIVISKIKQLHKQAENRERRMVSYQRDREYMKVRAVALLKGRWFNEIERNVRAVTLLKGRWFEVYKGYLRWRRVKPCLLFLIVWLFLCVILCRGCNIPTMRWELEAENRSLNEIERAEWLGARKLWMEKENEHSSMLLQKARVRWDVEGDENSRFFHSYVKRRNNKSNIRGLMVNGLWCEDPNTIKMEIARHYKSLFTEGVLIRPIFCCDRIEKLSVEDAALLEGEFSEKEVVEAVHGCGVNKAPGPDGFNFNFIKMFWEVLKTELINAINWFWNKSEISRGCNATFVTLIPKVADPIGLGDFRPISLIGCYYKIIAKMLAERIKKVTAEGLNAIVSEAVEKGIFKGVKIGSNREVVSHLQYADDTIFIGEWNKENAMSLMCIPKCFEEVFGLRINFNKSKLYGIGVNDVEVIEMSRWMRCGIREFPFTYLGLPIEENMRRIGAWNTVIEKFKKGAWSSRTVSDENSMISIIPTKLGWSTVRLSFHDPAELEGSTLGTQSTGREKTGSHTEMVVRIHMVIADIDRNDTTTLDPTSEFDDIGNCGSLQLQPRILMNHNVALMEDPSRATSKLALGASSKNGVEKYIVPVEYTIHDPEKCEASAVPKVTTISHGGNTLPRRDDLERYVVDDLKEMPQRFTLRTKEQSSRYHVYISVNKEEPRQRMERESRLRANSQKVSRYLDARICKLLFSGVYLLYRGENC